MGRHKGGQDHGDPNVIRQLISELPTYQSDQKCGHTVRAIVNGRRVCGNCSKDFGPANLTPPSGYRG